MSTSSSQSVSERVAATAFDEVAGRTFGFVMGPPQDDACQEDLKEKFLRCKECVQHQTADISSLAKELLGLVTLSVDIHDDVDDLIKKPSLEQFERALQASPFKTSVNNGGSVSRGLLFNTAEERMKKIFEDQRVMLPHVRARVAATLIARAPTGKCAYFECGEPLPTSAQHHLGLCEAHRTKCLEQLGCQLSDRDAARVYERIGVAADRYSPEVQNSVLYSVLFPMAVAALRKVGKVDEADILGASISEYFALFNPDNILWHLIYQILQLMSTPLAPLPFIIMPWLLLFYAILNQLRLLESMAVGAGLGTLVGFFLPVPLGAAGGSLAGTLSGYAVGKLMGWG